MTLKNKKKNSLADIFGSLKRWKIDSQKEKGKLRRYWNID